MQELRLVLIIVGALAIAALLFHGLWTSKKEKKSKFSAESFKKDDSKALASADNDDFEIIKKTHKDPAFGVERSFEHDPLDPLAASTSTEQDVFDEQDIPTIKLRDDENDIVDDKEIIFSDGDVDFISKPRKIVVGSNAPASVIDEPIKESDEVESEPEIEIEAEPELQVIVLHVHCSGDAPFVGTKLFDSMQQNGLIYGEMNIYHRHSDLSGNGKVLFSVANMMQPGTLEHDDPAVFTTKGISFFMTLPCFGEADQNFKLMLKTAQQIADDLSASVLDDQRNLLTPDKLASYRSQVREFDAAKNTPKN